MSTDNMIYSMTAFARGQKQGEWGSLICEIRSINHRFLEISVYLPEMLRAMEMDVRDHMRKILKRGKIECSIRYQAGVKMPGTSLAVNTALAQALCAASESIAKLLKNPAPTAPTDILRFQGVFESQPTNVSELAPEVFNLIEETLDSLVEVRAREGEELKQSFIQRLSAMSSELGKVKERLPDVLKEQQARLARRFQEAKVELDPARLEQEMVIFAQKIDIAEEIERTETHINEVKRVLQQGGVVGRRLDFLLQELNREANTMGSKSVDSLITHVAVEIKVLIEQIREQVQNIE